MMVSPESQDLRSNEPCMISFERVTTGIFPFCSFIAAR